VRCTWRSSDTLARGTEMWRKKHRDKLKEDPTQRRSCPPAMSHCKIFSDLRQLPGIFRSRGPRDRKKTLGSSLVLWWIAPQNQLDVKTTTKTKSVTKRNVEIEKLEGGGLGLQGPTNGQNQTITIMTTIPTTILLHHGKGINPRFKKTKIQNKV
jgi:hypothetical protein